MDETAPLTVRVLLVEDDEEDFRLVRQWLADSADVRFQLEWVSTPDEARALLARADHDVCLMDYRLGPETGLELLREAQVHGWDAPIILLTGDGEPETDLLAIQAGAADYLVKGEMSPPLLLRSLRHALERSRLLANARLQTEERQRAEAALQTVVSKARCLIWEYEVIDEGGAQLRWRPRVFDEAAAQRFLPLDTTGYPSYAAAWYLSRLDHDRESSDHYGETQVRLGRSYRQEFRCRDRDGAIRWLMEDVQVETVGPGRWQAVGVCTDITELREAEYRRRESLATLRAVMEGAADAIFVKDRDGRYLIINAAGAQMLGRTVDQVIGAHDTELFTADTVQQILDRDQAVLSTGERSSYEATATAAGVTRIYHATKGPMFGPDGAVVGVIGISRDVTERKQAEVALRESEERFRAVFESAGIGVEVTTLEGGVVMSNEVMQRMLGYSAPELRRMHIHDYVHPDYLSTDRALFEELVAGKLDRYQAEKRYVRKNGTEFLGRLTSSLVRDQAGAPQSVVRMVEDITEYRAATTALHLRDSAIRALPTGLLITDATQPENPISYVNPAFTEITGYPPEEALGRNTGFLEAPNADPATTDAILQAVRTGERIDCEVLNARKDGTLFWNALCIAPIRDPEGHLTHWVGIQQDVTQRRRLEEQLRQAQKMEAVGRLAGGVAHDFNNMLAVINGYASLLLPHARDDEFLRSGLGEIAKAGDRAAGLTRQLLAFSRQQVMELKDVDLHAVVENMTTMLGRLIGEDIDLLVIAAPGLGTVRADPGQIEQCLLNLAVNARDAMPKGGRLTIEIRNRVLDEEYALRQVEVQAGSYVQLAVSDSGCGMPPEVLARVFEPFYSTKGERGTGLGLATVYGIVKQSGGHISVYSEPGHGTSFQLYFPRVDATAQPLDDAEPAPPPRGGETVLLVEDEEMVRGLVQAALSLNGYTVLTAESGPVAVRVAAEHPGPIHLLLTDVVMPGGMSGSDTAEQLTASRPELKTLFMSGYTDDAIVHHGVLKEGIAFIQKPFTHTALARKVREVLG